MPKVPPAEPEHLATLSYVEPDAPLPKRLVIDLIERLSGRRRIEVIYRQLKREKPPFSTFFKRAFELGRVNLDTNARAEQQIPDTGPVVFIANHPFGVVDGVAMCDIAARTRGDFKILLNAMLCRDQMMDPLFLPISFEETRDAIRTNVETKRVTQDVLKQGGTIVIFPAGGVATRSKLGFGPLEDLPWSTFVAKIVAQTEATVVPAYFHGENGFLFHFVSAFSPTLRTALLLHEVVNKIGGTLRMTIGKPITWDEMRDIGSRKVLTQFLHERTFALGQEDPETRVELAHEAEPLSRSA